MRETESENDHITAIVVVRIIFRKFQWMCYGHKDSLLSQIESIWQKQTIAVAAAAAATRTIVVRIIWWELFWMQKKAQTEFPFGFAGNCIRALAKQ